APVRNRPSPTTVIRLPSSIMTTSRTVTSRNTSMRRRMAPVTGRTADNTSRTDSRSSLANIGHGSLRVRNEGAGAGGGRPGVHRERRLLFPVYRNVGAGRRVQVDGPPRWFAMGTAGPPAGSGPAGPAGGRPGGRSEEHT